MGPCCTAIWSFSSFERKLLNHTCSSLVLLFAIPRSTMDPSGWMHMYRSKFSRQHFDTCRDLSSVLDGSVSHLLTGSTGFRGCCTCAAELSGRGVSFGLCWRKSKCLGISFVPSLETLQSFFVLGGLAFWTVRSISFKGHTIDFRLLSTFVRPVGPQRLAELMTTVGEGVMRN